MKLLNLHFALFVALVSANHEIASHLTECLGLVKGLNGTFVEWHRFVRSLHIFVSADPEQISIDDGKMEQVKECFRQEQLTLVVVVYPQTGPHELALGILNAAGVVYQELANGSNRGVVNYGVLGGLGQNVVAMPTVAPVVELGEAGAMGEEWSQNYGDEDEFGEDEEEETFLWRSTVNATRSMDYGGFAGGLPFTTGT